MMKRELPILGLRLWHLAVSAESRLVKYWLMNIIELDFISLIMRIVQSGTTDLMMKNCRMIDVFFQSLNGILFCSCV